MLLTLSILFRTILVALLSLASYIVQNAPHPPPPLLPHHNVKSTGQVGTLLSVFVGLHSPQVNPEATNFLCCIHQVWEIPGGLSGWNLWAWYSVLNNTSMTETWELKQNGWEQVATEQSNIRNTSCRLASAEYVCYLLTSDQGCARMKQAGWY